ncbi:hypothetical protein TcWFU_004117 [Taenia crassiceps]|uniref:Fibronectin type-III domain-containing protein n=1 Tax=Taenia crassiceps TaxID=6207 RepID=A0ABR4QB23_9CEST
MPMQLEEVCWPSAHCSDSIPRRDVASTLLHTAGSFALARRSHTGSRCAGLRAPQHAKTTAPSAGKVLVSWKPPPLPDEVNHGYSVSWEVDNVLNGGILLP